jgi:hypothetical protein
MISAILVKREFSENFTAKIRRLAGVSKAG